jgi:hypothetical protein
MIGLLERGVFHRKTWRPMDRPARDGVSGSARQRSNIVWLTLEEIRARQTSPATADRRSGVAGRPILVLGYTWLLAAAALGVVAVLLWYFINGWVRPLLRVPLVAVLAPVLVLAAIMVGIALSALFTSPYEPPTGSTELTEPTITTTPTPSPGSETTELTTSASPTASPSASSTPSHSPSASPSASASPGP